MLFSIVVGFFEKFVYEGLGGGHNDESDAKKLSLDYVDVKYVMFPVIERNKMYENEICNCTCCIFVRTKTTKNDQ